MIGGAARTPSAGTAPVNVNKLKSLLYVSELGSVSAAASAVHLTQAAVSQHLKDLESELGLRLVDHSRRPVTLTREGDELVAVARRMLGQWSEYLERKRKVEIGGNLVLGHVRSAITGNVARALNNLRTRHAGLTIRLVVASGVTRHLAHDVLARRIDASFGVGPVSLPDELLWWPYSLERFYVVAPARYRGSTDEEVLTRGGYLRHKPQQLDETIIDHELERRGLRVDPIMEFVSYDTVLLMVEHDAGVGIVPESCLTAQKMQQLHCVPFGAPPLAREMGLMVRRDSPNLELVKLLWNALKDGTPRRGREQAGDRKPRGGRAAAPQAGGRPSAGHSADAKR